MSEATLYEIGHLHAVLLLAQYQDDSLFREPASFHRSLLQSGRTLAPRGGNSQGQVTATSSRGDESSQRLTKVLNKSARRGV